MKTSKCHTIIREDVIKWGENALIFFGPALIAFLAALTDSIPKEAASGIALLYVLNLITDGFKKWMKENRYRR